MGALNLGSNIANTMLRTELGSAAKSMLKQIVSKQYSMIMHRLAFPAILT